MSARACSTGVGLAPRASAILVLPTRGFVELILHLEQLANGRVDQAQGAQDERGQGSELAAGSAGVPVGDVDELSGGAGVGVVGQVPHLAGGVGVLAEHSEALADVGDVGVGVGLVGVAEHCGGPPGQGSGEDPIAEVGLGAPAGAEVVRGTPDGDRDPAGAVSVE